MAELVWEKKVAGDATYAYIKESPNHVATGTFGTQMWCKIYTNRWDWVESFDGDSRKAPAWFYKQSKKGNQGYYKLRLMRGATNIAEAKAMAQVFFDMEWDNGKAFDRPAHPDYNINGPPE
jgi:hypothetical protein